MQRLHLALMLAGGVLTGCAITPPPMYAWGSYEQMLYTTYSTPGATADVEQIAALERDRETARATGRPLPPGWRAHLGYLYANVGRLDDARAEFEAEKLNFPESRVLMDRLLANLART